MHAYGGGIDEILGVSVFMALSVGLLSVAGLRGGRMPTWLAGLGIVSALLLAGLARPAFGTPDVVPVAAAVSLLSVGMIAAGVWVLRGRLGQEAGRTDSVLSCDRPTIRRFETQPEARA